MVPLSALKEQLYNCPLAFDMLSHILQDEGELFITATLPLLSNSP